MFRKLNIVLIAKKLIRLLLKGLIILFLFPAALLYALLFRLFTPRRSANNILIAGTETSANLKEISAALGKTGKYRITVMQFYEHPFYGVCDSQEARHIKTVTIYQSDSSFVQGVKYLLRPFYIFRVLTGYDVVFFNWSESFFPLNFDYLIISISKMKLIVRHCGSDVRYYPLQHGIHSSFGVQQWKNGQRSIFEILQKIWRQRVAEFFAIVISTRDHATFQGRELVIRPYVQEAMPRTRGFARSKPLILHAPSKPKIKGSSLVIDALNNLKKEGYIFDYEILANVKHSIVLAKLAETSIVIDQPGAVPARFAVEAMASGCAVIGGNVVEINGLVSCPIIPFKPEISFLEYELKKLLQDAELCKTVGDKSFTYWKNYCSPEAFVLYFEDLLNNKAPTFKPINNHSKFLYDACEKWYEKVLVRWLYSSQ